MCLVTIASHYLPERGDTPRDGLTNTRNNDLLRLADFYVGEGMLEYF